MTYGPVVAKPNFVPTAEIARAVEFAIREHGDQTRKSSAVPYIQHLLGVASIAMEFGAGETETVAAILHDVIEDTAVEEADLKEEFGTEVAEIVMWCSAEAKSDDDPVETWRPRKEAYLQHLSVASAAAVLVSLADKIHNARSIAADRGRAADEEEFWGRFNASREDQQWYYRELVDMYSRRVGDPEARITEAMVDELRRAIAGFSDQSG